TYQTDTISLSRVLEKEEELLDFVLFHEMLHKKHRYYKSKTGKLMHHHTAFRQEEQSYPGFAELEKRLEKLVRKKRFMRWFTRV
ncbi:MAG: hypothetical protein ACMXYA_03705, partial [Candidatus Woesearchaeota archaeon]